MFLNGVKKMSTLLLTSSSGHLETASQLLLQGEVVGMPTETVYGLAADAFNTDACARIFKAKNRPSDNPLIVHIDSIRMLEEIADPASLTQQVRLLVRTFWPGPLTLILPLRQPTRISPLVTCGLPTVGIRMPAHPLALDLIRYAGVPLAAPSANLSGSPSPTTAQHVMNDLGGRIGAVLDGGSCMVGVESTVIDMFHPSGPVILRPGGITAESLRQHVPSISIFNKDWTDAEMQVRPSTPGMKYRHYSPNAKVILFKNESDVEKQRIKIREWMLENCLVDKDGNRSGEKRRIGYLCVGSADEWIARIENVFVYSMGSTPAEVASKLYDGLREMDLHDVEVVVAEGVSDEMEGLAVMNRLEKAASQIVS